MWCEIGTGWVRPFRIWLYLRLRSNVYECECVRALNKVCEGEWEHSNKQSAAVIRFGSLQSLLNLSSVLCNREWEQSCIFMKQGGHNQRHANTCARTHTHTHSQTQTLKSKEDHVLCIEMQQGHSYCLQYLRRGLHEGRTLGAMKIK